MSGDPPLIAGNTRVRDARRLSRRRERTQRRLFLADGPKAVEGALSLPGCLVEVFATTAATRRYADLAVAVAGQGAAWTLVEERALESLSDSVTPAGLVGVVRFVDRPVDLVLERAPSLVVVCADVRDPGNAGTVVRCADAVGADGVVLTGSSVDAYNPKTVRASVGSLFHVPLAVETDPRVVLAGARAAGLVVLAADGAGEVDLDEADDLLVTPTAWLFGNEAHGLGPDLLEAADHRVRIPIHGRAESLNLSTAAAVCLYASARIQHRRPR